jgi:hypothetical protein
MRTWRETILAAHVLLAGCGGEGGAPLRDITAASRVDFVHRVERTGAFPLPEIMGAGCAIFDADGDGRLDLYFTNAGRCGGEGAPNALYLRAADGTYRDASASSGLADAGYGMGVAVGDIDNDGDLDVYVGNDGPDALYRNDGGGRFTDVTAHAGIVGGEWTTSVAFLDFDVDGWLDVWVVHYVAYDPNRACNNQSSARDYCTPKVFAGVPDRLYRNRGDGTFEDVSERAGIAGVAFNGLGITVEDFDDDGWPDVYVANDGQANHLWRNARDGTFRESALALGCAVNANGAAEASMGVAAGDVDGDGDLDLFMTHLWREKNTLYVREDHGFVDGSMQSGLAAPSYPFTGFGTALLDLEHDGDLDVVIVNGRVEQGPSDPRAGGDPFWSRYAETNQIFVGDGSGRFSDASAGCAAFCSPVEVSRGLAVDDLDGDGDLDVVLANLAGPARLYENVAEKRGHWLQVRAVDRALQRDVYGAVVRVHAGGKVLRRTVGPASSYLSSSSIAVHFGLGAASAIDRIEVRWPGGEHETFVGIPVDQRIVLTRGEGAR